ncbi:TonB-dependent receptor [Thalassotalea euphylliae]|uniref:TonB-dependent receptor n=1 Tax=Thalassotalea euphylliae TaxID=1655234 RepID=A0A3E0TKY4_9GAMM|nr:TonB-dependent receptor [Thalassotalea euphylliae]REL25221.1 TonB-dependent receptor [Thalassotalea euphylliae]
MNKTRILSSLLPAFTVLTCVAQTEVITVTGSRLSDAAVSAQSVLTAEQIQQINPISTTQLLNAIPHLSLKENANGAGQSFVSIRGGESNFTLVMIDNVVVNDPTNSRGGGFDFNQINVAAIERIEVHRGSPSAIYGSDALSGVIHIITKTDSNTSVSLAAGSEDYRSGALTLTTNSDSGLSGLLSLSQSQRDASQFENYDNTQALIKVRFNDEQQSHQLMLNYSSKDSDSLAEDSGGVDFASPMLAEVRENQQLIAALQSKVLLTNDYLESLNVNVSWSEHTQDANHPGILPQLPQGVPASEIESQYEEKNIDVHVTGQFQAVQWAAGASAEDKTGTNTGFLNFGFELPVNYRLEQTDYSAFIETNVAVDQLKINLGARFENPENFASDTAVRLAASYQINQLTLFSSYSESFKLPSFFALAHPLVGNENLLPEEADSVELGIKFTPTNSVTGELVWYANDFTNLVDFDPELFTSVNRSQVKTQGVELTSSYQHDWLNLQVYLGYLDVDVVNENTQLRRRPDWSGGVNASVTLDDVTTSLILDTQAEFYDSSVPTGLRTLGGYTTIDINSLWQVNDNVSLTFTIDNLLDKSYQESIGFYGAERQLRVGITWQI